MNDLNDLERELGPSLRVALRRAAAAITSELETDALSLSGNGDMGPTALLDADASLLNFLGDHDGLGNGHSHVAAIDLSPARAERRARRRWLIVAAAAAAVLLIAGGVLVQQTGEDDGGTVVPISPAPNSTLASKLSTRNSAPPESFPAGLPPEGAAPPSSPQTNELVTSVARIQSSAGHVDDDSATATTVNPVAPPPVSPAPSTTAATAFFPGLYPDLPPAGATPSSPQIGELVAAVARIHAGAWFVYADGRLISIAVDGDSWVEQRLTPEAVERVRAEFLRTRLFDADQPPNHPAGGALFGTVVVRDGDRLLSAQLSPREADANDDVSRLIRYFTVLDSWPPDSWVDRQIKEYVASRYGFCVSRVTSESTHAALPDPSTALTLLPARAVEVLGGRQASRLGGIDATCFEVTRAQAGALVDEFGSRLMFDVAEPVPMIVSISMWALLPHGAPAISGG